jgi:transposase-like protein
MARNVVQFQKGLSEPAFEQQYGTEEQCRAIVIASRWPRGFECPACGATQHCVVTTRDLYQCTKCRRQTSPIAGTIFASTHLPLRLWFRAIYHLTQTKQGISSIELGRRLGVTQTTAWKIKHKLKQVMLEHDATKRLTGRIEIDDAHLDGERSGGKRGRGAPGKTPFVAAVETTTEGKPVRLKLRRVTSFCATSIAGFAKRSLDPDCSVVSDGLQCRMRAPGHQDRVRTKGGSDACLQMGQHRAGQHQGRHHRNLPRHQQQACPALPRRIRIPLQQTIRSGRHDPAPHMGRRANHTHAISAP